jgi:phosphoglycerate dehydrogenase-like enzyme
MERLTAVADVAVDATNTLDALPGADIAILGPAYVEDPFLDRAGPSLRLVIRHGIGYDRVNVKACSARGVLTANTPDGPTESTAEHAVALLLALAKRLQPAGASMRAGTHPTKLDLQGTEVLGRTLGLVGFGRIGRRVGEICALGLGMRVVVHDPFAREAIARCDWAEAASSLDDLLAGSDFVSLHTSLSAETRHLIGRRELGLMRAGAYLINVSRGPVVDEAALIDALRDGHLAGAGLDVFDPEPPEVSNPLLTMPDVIVTPHVASNTAAGIARMSESVVDQIIQLLGGEPPSFLIDRSAWPGRAPLDGR